MLKGMGYSIYYMWENDWNNWNNWNKNKNLSVPLKKYE